jgi:SET domain-containing protein
MNLKVSTKVEVKNSPIHGLGVFATEEIKIGEMIEECHLITLPFKPVEQIFFLCDYKFNYPAEGNVEEYVIALGNGSIYNHSENNNACWRNHPEYKAFQFVAIRDIKVGEEICIYYGDENYWINIEIFKQKNIIKL